MWVRLTFRLPRSQGEEYWKLRQISLFEGVEYSREMFGDGGQLGWGLRGSLALAGWSSETRGAGETSETG